MSVLGMNKLRVELLNAATVDETTSGWVDCSAYTHITIYVIGTGTTSGGVITIEEADFNPNTAADYTGTWDAIDTVNASSVSGGAQQAAHLTVGCYGYIRTRVSTAITGGGSISTVLRAV